MTTHAPRPIIVARWTAIAQALIAGVLAALLTAFTLISYVADRSSARSGHPNDWAGADQILGGVLAAICLVACALLAVPAARLRAGRPLARTALVLGEAITCAPLAALLSSRITRNFSGLLFVLFVGLGIVTVVALFRPSARRWAEDQPPCTGPLPSERVDA
jgi:hypothetical protein